MWKNFASDLLNEAELEEELEEEAAWDCDKYLWYASRTETAARTNWFFYERFQEVVSRHSHRPL